MKSLKENLSGMLLCLFELAVGILLLVDPIGFTSGIIFAFGIVLLVIGAGSCIRYFLSEPMEAAKGQMLLKGMVAVLGGVICVIKADWFVITVPVLTLIYGAAVLITGLAKLQRTVDMLRLKKRDWPLSAISAAVSLACGAIIITDPFGSAAALWIFAGISLIVEAVFDVIALILGIIKGRQTDADSEAAEV